MTIPYNASWFSCFTDFIKCLREDGIEYGDLGEKEQFELKKIHNDFYLHIKKNIKKEFYIKETAVFKLFKYNK